MIILICSCIAALFLISLQIKSSREKRERIRFGEIFGFWPEMLHDQRYVEKHCSGFNTTAKKLMANIKEHSITVPFNAVRYEKALREYDMASKCWRHFHPIYTKYMPSLPAEISKLVEYKKSRRVEIEAVSTKCCSICGTEMKKAAAVFCTTCGARLEAVEQPAASQLKAATGIVDG